MRRIGWQYSLTVLPTGHGPSTVTAAFVLGAALGAIVAMATFHHGARSMAPRVEAAERPSSDSAGVGRYAVDVLRVIDGDTFEARVHVWPGLDLTTRVRLRGIDAPEMKARCDDERVRAEAARDALRALLAERDVTIAGIGPDKYFGRVVADVATPRTGDVSAALLAKGVARAYSGGRRESWCEARIAG